MPEDTTEGPEPTERPRSSADLVPGGRSSATIGSRVAGAAVPPATPEAAPPTEPFQPLDPSTPPSGVPFVPSEEAVGEAVVWGPSVFDETDEDTVFGVGEDPRPDVRWVRHRSTWGPLPRWGLVVLAILLAFVVGYRWIHDWADDQVRPDRLFGDDVRFVIEEGWSTNDVAVALGAADVIDNPAMFRQWMRCPSALRWLIECPVGVAYEFQAGEYILREHLEFQAAVDRLNEGPLPEEVITVMVPEGLTLAQTVDRLLDQMPAFDGDELRAALISERLEWEHYPEDLPYLLVEGLLFPDTYQLAEESLGDELDLVTRMHRQFVRVVDELDLVARSGDLGLTPYEVVVLASLIEEEALIDADRARISRVIHNRIERDWLLGIDASTRYAVGKTAGEPLTSEDLAFESLWNTRAVRGLPPTPIANPGRASLEAALHPVDGDWMYYVRTDEDGVVGAHTFAVTADEFERAKQVCIEKDLGCG